MKRLFAVTLGVLTAIGGFVDIGDIVTNAGWLEGWLAGNVIGRIPGGRHVPR